MAAIGSLAKGLATLATAAVLLPQARGTNVIVDSVTWTLIENSACGTATISGGVSGEALQYGSEAEAKAACQELGFDCYGIYDMMCAGDTYFLCSADVVTEQDDLEFSDSSCVQEMTIITGTATTTTATTTTIPAAPAPAPASAPAPAPPPASAPAATTAAPAAAPATTTQVALGGGALDACEQTCSLLDGDATMTCREQIMTFKPPTEDTGSMPALEMTCENKRALVSAQGTCQDCSGCDVCETTLADTRLWKISDSDETVETTGRWGAVPLVACVAAFVGALVVAAAVVVRRRFGWEHLREQPEEA